MRKVIVIHKTLNIILETSFLSRFGVISLFCQRCKNLAKSTNSCLSLLSLVGNVSLVYDILYFMLRILLRMIPFYRTKWTKFLLKIRIISCQKIIGDCPDLEKRSLKRKVLQLLETICDLNSAQSSIKRQYLSILQCRL